MAFFMEASRPTFWSLPSMFLSRSGAAAGIALINSVGNLGGVIGPVAVGWLKDTTHSFAGGLYFIAVTTAISAILVMEPVPGTSLCARSLREPTGHPTRPPVRWPGVSRGTPNRRTTCMGFEQATARQRKLPNQFAVQCGSRSLHRQALHNSICLGQSTLCRPDPDRLLHRFTSAECANYLAHDRYRQSG